jgi:agmatinase
MSPLFDYPTGSHLVFGGGASNATSFEESRGVVLPIPLDRTTSYVAGTRNGPREILLASAQMELWDDELRAVPLASGVHTLAEMDLPFATMAEAMTVIEHHASRVFEAGKFLVVLGGEHSITPAVVRAAVKARPGLSVLQIDAHADLRESYHGSRDSHACAMRRTLEHVPCVQVGIRSLSEPEAKALPSLPTRVFYDIDMRRDPDWIARVVDCLTDTVYVTIDCDGLDPAIMPAVGTPEPGGLSWHELLAVLRATFERRTVIGCDVVELCPLPGMVAPNFLCAKLVHKLLGYGLLGSPASA